MSHHDFNDAAEGTAIGVIVTFIINEILPWTIHTLAAIATAIIVAGCVFFVNRWLRKKFK